MKHGIFGRRQCSRHVNCAAAAICLLAVAALLPPSANALSALAAGIPDDVATQGVAFGEGHNYSTREGAEARALQECRNTTGVPASTTALCKIVAHFDNQCLAISLDPKAGTPGFGWAIAAAADPANNQALGNCRATAGADRVGYCVESLTSCDTKN
jgi:hypothetical protein